MEKGGILKGGLFLVFKMWPAAAAPKQMGDLQSSSRPNVLTVVCGPVHSAAVFHWITG